MSVENAFDRVERLMNQWQRNAPPLPPDAKHLLRKMVRSIVLDAAAVCRGRALGKRPTAHGEAMKCADSVAHFLLCKEGESVCLKCDGYGCRACGHQGIKGASKP